MTGGTSNVSSRPVNLPMRMRSAVSWRVDACSPEDPRFEVVAANYQGLEFGSVCLRRVSA